MKYAPLWKRFFAYVIDLALVAGMVYLLCLLLNWVVGDRELPQGLALLVFLSPFVVDWLYFTLQESSRKGQTPGKMLLKIQVKHATGLPLTFSQASVRWKLRYHMYLFVLAYWVIPPLWWNRNRQFLHDTTVQSLVLEKPESEK